MITWTSNYRSLDMHRYALLPPALTWQSAMRKPIVCASGRKRDIGDVYSKRRTEELFPDVRIDIHLS